MVTVCNTAELCTSVSSDGVMIDNSPPKAGIVQDGAGFIDLQYQFLKQDLKKKQSPLTKLRMLLESWKQKYMPKFK